MAKAASCATHAGGSSGKTRIIACTTSERTSVSNRCKSCSARILLSLAVEREGNLEIIWTSASMRVFRRLSFWVACSNV